MAGSTSLLALRGCTGKSHPSPNALAWLEKLDPLQVEWGLLPQASITRRVQLPTQTPDTGTGAGPGTDTWVGVPRVPPNLQLIR